MVCCALLYVSGSLVHLINESLRKLGLKFNVQFSHFISEFLVLIVLLLLSLGVLLFLLFQFEFSHCTQVFHPFGFLYRMLFLLLLYGLDSIIKFAYVLLLVQIILGHPMKVLQRTLLHLRPLRDRIQDCLVHHVLCPMPILLKRLVHISISALMIILGPRLLILLQRDAPERL